MSSEIIQKREFAVASFEFECGIRLENLTIGYEYMGELNASGDNCIFICQPLTGDSHFAGKYQASDVKAGYLDSLVGRGKPIDTAKYFVLSADALCCASVSDTKVVTAGPRAIDSRTGHPYAMSFPVVTHRDQVKIHKLLLDHLGVQRLKLVLGFSMGGAMAVQWAFTFPNFVERVLPIKGRGLATPALIVSAYDTMIKAIQADANWKAGNYYGAKLPISGIRLAVQVLTQVGYSFSWAERECARNWSAGNPGASFENLYLISECMTEIVEAKAKKLDANSFLYLCKGEQLFSACERGVTLPRTSASFLFVSESSDGFSTPIDVLNRDVLYLRDCGIHADLMGLNVGNGHYTTIGEMPSLGPVIESYLAFSLHNVDVRSGFLALIESEGVQRKVT